MAWQEGCSGPSRRELLHPGMQTLVADEKSARPGCSCPSFLEAEALTFVGMMTLRHEVIRKESRDLRCGGGRREAEGGAEGLEITPLKINRTPLRISFRPNAATRRYDGMHLPTPQLSS